MLGWTEITTDPESEQYLSDPLTTDGDSATLFELGAVADGAIRASYGLLDAGLVIRDLAPHVGEYRRAGWLTFA